MKDPRFWVPRVINIPPNVAQNGQMEDSLTIQAYHKANMEDNTLQQEDCWTVYQLVFMSVLKIVLI